jgi:hypothetical protein
MPNEARITLRYNPQSKIPQSISTAEPVIDSAGTLFVGVNGQPQILGVRSGVTLPALELILENDLVAIVPDRSRSVVRRADSQDGFFCVGWALNPGAPGDPITIVTAKGAVFDVSLPDGDYYLGEQGAMTLIPPPDRKQLIGRVADNKIIFAPSTAILSIPAPAVNGITVPIAIRAGISKKNLTTNNWIAAEYHKPDVLVFQDDNRSITFRLELEPSLVPVELDIHLHGTAQRNVHYLLTGLPVSGTVLSAEIDGSTQITTIIPPATSSWEFRLEPLETLQAMDLAVQAIATITAVVTAGYRASYNTFTASGRIGSGIPVSRSTEILIRDIPTTSTQHFSLQQFLSSKESDFTDKLELVPASSGVANNADLIRVTSAFI